MAVIIGNNSNNNNNNNSSNNNNNYNGCNSNTMVLSSFAITPFTYNNQSIVHFFPLPHSVIFPSWPISNER